MAEREGRASLNVTGRIARAFLHSKLTPLIILAITVFGALAVVLTPRTYNPDIIVPVVNVTVQRPGFSAPEMLNQVVRPLEALLAAIPDVDHTYGTAQDDLAMVTVRFKVGQDEEKSLVRVYNQISSNIDRLPPGARQPFVQQLSLFDVPILTLTFSSSKIPTDSLRNVALHVLEQLTNVPGVGKTTIQGAAARAVRVWLDPARLVGYGLSPDAVRAAIETTNVNSPAGHVVTDNREHPIRVAGALGDAEAVGAVVVAVHNGHPVFLRDVATVTSAPASSDVRSFIAFGPSAKDKAEAAGPAVTIAIARQKGTNGVDVAEAVLAKLQRIKAEALPQGVFATFTRDDGATANDAVNTLMEHLTIAIVAVVAILLAFLGWREAGVVALSIPLILFVVLGVGWVAGQTINRITLFALILSLGLLVDDSIVVIENIHRHLHHAPQRNLSRLVIAAANEIGKPTIIATLTVMLALIPMAFVTGMMGPFMMPIPFNAPVAMIASLFMAYTVVPYIAYRWLRRKALRIVAEHEKALDERGAEKRDWMRAAYLKLFRPLLHTGPRRVFMGVVFVLLLGAMAQPAWQFIRPQGTNGPLSSFGVGLKMLPDDNVDTFLVEIDAPEGTPLEDTGRVAAAVDGMLAGTPYVTNYQTFLGEAAPEDFAALVRGDVYLAGPNFAQIRVNLVSKHDRAIGSHQIAEKLYAALAPVRAAFPETRIKIRETPPGPPVRSQMMAAIYGPDYATLRNLAEEFRTKYYPRVYGMINVDSSVQHEVDEFKVVIDPQPAAIAGFSAQAAAAAISAYFAGVQAGSTHDPTAREPVPIILRLPRPQRIGASALDGIYLTDKAGKPVALSSIAHVEKLPADQWIFTRDQHPVSYVTGHMLRSSPVNGVIALTKELSGRKLANGQKLIVGNLGLVAAQPDDVNHYALHWLGEMRLTLDVFRDLGAAFIVALLLIYLLLAGYYSSFFMPVVVMGAIPLTLIGVFPGHWAMHEPFTATSMIGVIALAGIVVRNSLLLIDFILARRAEGLSLEDAVMEAGAVRLRPIILTALAIILGSAIMVSDPVFGGLAISLIFGALASTTLTLFVIPLVYYCWQDARRRRWASPPPTVAT
ncbi:efflux RND transporter permease subunit [Rhodoblastus acidophilus]|uniref:Efflux RND transporter permease subunit n=1 Tax=Candidatus Rhodoblastus alkanivorans TaxID=2954117 RepID=A0ABS9Z8V1_9HYPH|nr:efflux RND transporter permease subunit [Candidatus Rhodoblastus alkanivorans]MCI4678728.1 efflux RND transporter permease subunit [Candidatus Rhodoblastus alkanivorans]MCI4683476.1 efflux RND transporter permease subunit [Candidatus Rhodoblastus alkanivorans]MDI4640790.1 efflux RND transporter permease subunit [Rhodoblastus acidophilus]